MNLRVIKSPYVAYGIVFAASLLFAIFIPLSQVFRTISATPAVLALFAAFLQIFRDQLSHERSIALLEIQNTYALGATSHMATVAFDKHVSFCEEYVADTIRTMMFLFRRGPDAEAVKYADDLFKVRMHWTVWVTREMDAQLEAFENAVRRIGADAHLLTVEDLQDRAMIVKRVYAEFAKVLNLKEWGDTDNPADVAVEAVVAYIRTVLRVSELTNLRTRLIENANRAPHLAGVAEANRG
jgi:hypothetical protein